MSKSFSVSLTPESFHSSLRPLCRSARPAQAVVFSATPAFPASAVVILRKIPLQPIALFCHKGFWPQATENQPRLHRPTSNSENTQKPRHFHISIHHFPSSLWPLFVPPRRWCHSGESVNRATTRIPFATRLCSKAPPFPHFHPSPAPFPLFPHSTPKSPAISNFLFHISTPGLACANGDAKKSPGSQRQPGHV